jgi:tetratricopeptide (TPR) repeat protein
VIRRVPLNPFVCAVLLVAATASAQTARTMGTVRDTDGRPVKGATIRATNPDAIPRQVVSITDDKGRFAILGMRIGTYSFTIEAPGFVTVQASAAVRTAVTPPLQIMMARDPGPIPGALPSNIQAQLAAASMLRDQGRLDQAINAYQEIRVKNPKFTAVNLALADMYRKKAAQETDPAARRSLLERAIESYDTVLKSDVDNARAKTELELTRAEVTAAAR